MNPLQDLATYLPHSRQSNHASLCTTYIIIYVAGSLSSVQEITDIDALKSFSLYLPVDKHTCLCDRILENLPSTHEGHMHKTGADLRGGSLKQGVWEHSPRSYRILCLKCHLMQDLEYLSQILKLCEKDLTIIVPGGVMGPTV